MSALAGGVLLAGQRPLAAGMPLADSDHGKGSPIGLFVVLLLLVATYLLYRSMSGHLRRLPERFPGYRPADGEVADGEVAASEVAASEVAASEAADAEGTAGEVTAGEAAAGEPEGAGPAGSVPGATVGQGDPAGRSGEHPGPS